MVKDNTINVGGIITSRGRPCFRIIFPDKETAWKYKEMFTWILRDDKYPVEVRHGYYDKPTEE